MIKKAVLIDPWSKTLPVHNLYGQANAIIFHGYFVTAPENNIQDGPRKSSPPSFLHVSLILY
jgi:hypothetical protein